MVEAASVMPYAQWIVAAGKRRLQPWSCLVVALPAKGTAHHARIGRRLDGGPCSFEPASVSCCGVAAQGILLRLIPAPMTIDLRHGQATPVLLVLSISSRMAGTRIVAVISRVCKASCIAADVKRGRKMCLKGKPAA